MSRRIIKSLNGFDFIDKQVFESESDFQFRLTLRDKLVLQSNGFSNREWALFWKIAPLIGAEIAGLLIAMKGRGGVSFKEIEIGSILLSEFEQLKVYSYREKPREVCIDGKFFNGEIRFTPQMRVNYDENQDYIVDYFFDLYIPVCDDWLKIETIILEYDGHVGHFVESSIKRSQIRELRLMISSNGNIAHFHDEMWNDQDIRRDIFKYIYGKFELKLRLFKIMESRQLFFLLKTEHRIPDFEIVKSNGESIAVPRMRLA